MLEEVFKRVKEIHPDLQFKLNIEFVGNSGPREYLSVLQRHGYVELCNTLGDSCMVNNFHLISDGNKVAVSRYQVEYFGEQMLDKSFKVEDLSGILSELNSQLRLFEIQDETNEQKETK